MLGINYLNRIGGHENPNMFTVVLPCSCMALFDMAQRQEGPAGNWALRISPFHHKVTSPPSM